MTYRRMMYVPMLLLLLTMGGCTAGRVFDAGSPEEQRKSATSKDELWNQTVALEKENAAYQKRLAAQQAELERLNKELTDQRLEIDQTSKQATELAGSVDDLTAKVKQLQDARLREHPLREANLAQPEIATGRQEKRTAIPKKEALKKAKARDAKPKSDRDAQVKMLQETEQKIPPPQEVEAPPVKKDEKKEPAEVKAPKPRSVEDLSAQMKQFEESRQRGTAPQETEPGETKKEPLKQGKKAAIAKKDAQQEPAEPKARRKLATIKVLAGDGDIASARGLAKRLVGMGYRVKLVDQAPRSDFAVTTVYHGTDYRTAAETLAKRLGGGATARPMTWSSSFDIIVVTGGKP